jgi:hypothetical protein
MGNFNRVVHSLKEAGITIFWEMEVVRQFLSERRQLSVVQSRAPPDLGPKKLRLVHIQGAFILLFVGTAIASVAILSELAYFRYVICSLYVFIYFILFLGNGDYLSTPVRSNCDSE